MNYQLSLFAQNLPEKEAPKQSKDIRTASQSQRKIAYDVGDKIGGARKDEFALKKAFEDKQDIKTLETIENHSTVLAAEMVSKTELFKSFSLEKEKEKGTEPAVARIKQLIIQRIDAIPAIDSPEGRKAFLLAADYYQKEVNSIRTLDGLIDNVYLLRKKISYETTGTEYIEKRIHRAQEKLLHSSEYTAENVVEAQKDLERYTALLQEVEKAKEIPIHCLGKKFTNFFTNSTSANNTLNNVRKKVKSWDDLLKPKTQQRSKGKNKPVWEREIPERPDRIGGNPSAVRSPEGLMDAFGFRGIEFGHYLNDEIGIEHLVRCSEAYSDLSDILEMSHLYSISLNGSLAMAFGSRGRGAALGHFEPNSKVINLTRDRGGLGITAHEWFHGLDNWLYDISNRYKNGIPGFISRLEGVGGNISPGITEAFRSLMSAITEGNHVAYFENTNQAGTEWRISSLLKQSYLQNNGNLLAIMQAYKTSLEEALKKRLTLIETINGDVEKEKAKSLKKNERDLKKYAQALGWYHEQQTGERIETIPYPSNHSQFLGQAILLDRGKQGKYWSSSVELVARAFESYVEDKLEEAGRKNDYLVCGTHDNRAFPIGEERKKIHAKFDELMQLLRKVHLL